MATNFPIPSDLIAAFCRKWRVAELSLFGSVLRNDFRPDSDVDVLIAFPLGCSPSLEDWLDMEDELRAIFGRRIDLVERRLVDNPFRRHHILTHRQVVYAA